MIGNLATFLQDPSDRLDYSINWANWVTSGDSISVSSWSVAAISDAQQSLMNIPAGFGSTINTSLHTTTVWLQQGVAENDYLITNTITTVQSRVAERSFTIQCRDR